MPLLIHDQVVVERMLSARQTSGGDRYDEVWEGVYVMAPLADNEHQRLVMELAIAFSMIVDARGLGRTLPGANVSDRREDWTDNYRVPDVLVVLNQSSAVDCQSHWHGGPDVAVEIVSPGDQTLEKLDFYAQVGTRELLVVDRRPWRVTLYRATEEGKRLVPIAVSSENQPASIHSNVIPVQLAITSDGSAIVVEDSDGTPIRSISIRSQS